MLGLDLLSLGLGLALGWLTAKPVKVLLSKAKDKVVDLVKY